MRAAILVDWETHFTIFVYRRFEIEILGIVECRAIFRLEAQAGRQARASRHAGWQPARQAGRQARASRQAGRQADGVGWGKVRRDGM